MTKTVRTRYSPAVLQGIAAGERVVLRLTLARNDSSALTDAAATALSRGLELAAVSRENEPPISPVACKKGCHSCCSAKVLVSPPEVVRIANYARATLDKNAFDQLVKKVDEALSRSAGLTRAERIKESVPCPLLDNVGACIMHEVRPLICAGWNSLDAAGCDAYFIAHTAEKPPELHPQSNEVCLAVLGGLIGAAIDRKLDGRPLELHAALAIALRDEFAGEKWRRNEPVFEDAIDREVSPY